MKHSGDMHGNAVTWGCRYSLAFGSGDFGGVIKRNIFVFVFSRQLGVHRISCVGVRYLRVKVGTSGWEHS